MAPASSSSDVAGSQEPLVMVVDDSATMRRSVMMTLERGGYRVVLAENGAEALARLKGGLRPDLLLTDIVMPEMDGVELIRAARQLLRFTPIVALTTQGQRHYRDQGKSAGATAWLIKPTGGRELLDLVASFVPRAAPTKTAG
ncbi:response regulator [Pseudaquabacterium rugosum]|uniref:Response regulator n=1 Tax=Pseudaquabacterium rugosum TaxID=2984194 RepID=A0ABU9BGM3_9BURK